MRKTLADVLNKYRNLPEWLGEDEITPNSRSNFGNFPMNIAAATGDVEAMLLLMNNNALIDAPGEDGFTPLHDAVEQGQIEAVRFLLSMGADADCENSDGMTPIDLAMLLSEEEISSILTENGCSSKL